MKRRHSMPFGAELRADGTTRFRLWAPGAREVALELSDPGSTQGRPRVEAIAMRAEGDGWFALECRAPAGTRYAFRIDGGALVPDPASRCESRRRACAQRRGRSVARTSGRTASGAAGRGTRR